MIHASVTIVANPGQREGILQALRSMVGPTRVEPGCLSCHLYEDVERQGSFTLVEQWATPEQFQRRLVSETYRRLLLLVELSVVPPDIQFREVSHTRGVEAIHEARGQ
jgi:quinol monooxygenase YgiN